MTSDSSARQYIVLVALSLNPGMSQKAIVDETGIDRSTVADLVRRIVGKGLVSAKRDRKDRRAKNLTLTTKGEAELVRLKKTAARVEVALFNALSAKQRDGFVQDLIRLAARERN